MIYFSRTATYATRPTIAIIYQWDTESALQDKDAGVCLLSVTLERNQIPTLSDLGGVPVLNINC